MMVDITDMQVIKTESPTFPMCAQKKKKEKTLRHQIYNEKTTEATR